MNKSCYNCYNERICIHKQNVFKLLDDTYFLEDIEGLLEIMGKEVAKRCKWWKEKS